MRYTVIGSPVSAGAPTDGMQYGYEGLTALGLAKLFPDGTLSIPDGRICAGTDIYDNDMKYAPEITGFCRRLSEKVSDAVRSGRIAVTIGGDHSLAAGSIAGCASVLGADEISVVYVDGHTDINTPESTETGYLHGMPIASAMGICPDIMTVGGGINLYGKNTFIIGARSIDRGEYPIIEKQKVTLYTADDVRRRGLENTVSELIGRITTKYIHLSFDADFIDGDEFFATGYVMPDGLSAADAEYIIRRIAATGKVCSADFVEYNPSRDVNGKCGKIMLGLIGAFVETVEKE